MSAMGFFGTTARVRLISAASALAFGSPLAASPAAAEVCRFAPVRPIDKEVGVEPQLLIDGTCTDPGHVERRSEDPGQGGGE